MTYTLVVFFLLGHGPGEGRFEKSVTPISDYTTCMHLEHAINLKDFPAPCHLQGSQGEDRDMTPAVSEEMLAQLKKMHSEMVAEGVNGWPVTVGAVIDALSAALPLPVEGVDWQAIFDKEEAALRKYRDEDCQGDDAVKQHAWTVADARLSEVGVLRRKLLEATPAAGPSAVAVKALIDEAWKAGSSWEVGNQQSQERAELFDKLASALFSTLAPSAAAHKCNCRDADADHNCTCEPSPSAAPPPGWSDPLKSPQAEAIRNGKIDDTEIHNLFDTMERELVLLREANAERCAARASPSAEAAQPVAWRWRWTKEAAGLSKHSRVNPPWHYDELGDDGLSTKRETQALYLSQPQGEKR
jgi:hypothetical protein